jgi:uncharacterized FlaG/YvyC family protein
MNETSISPISSVRLSESVVPVKYVIPDKAEPVISDSGKPVKQVENESEQAKNLSNVSIHFQVDEETQQLTVFLIDKASRRVIRSIPANELNKLQAGDLLKLTA